MRTKSLSHVQCWWWLVILLPPSRRRKITQCGPARRSASMVRSVHPCLSIVTAATAARSNLLERFTVCRIKTCVRTFIIYPRPLCLQHL